MANFLLEIGLEEMPAHVVTPSIKQFKEKMQAFLNEQRLDFSEIKTYSTPRRLAIEVIDIAEKQKDVEKKAKGPAKKVALDSEGNFTKAALGFARGQNVSTDDLFFEELKGVEYVYAKKFIQGKEAKKVLEKTGEVIKDLKFPTMMRWGYNKSYYVRPVRWLVSLFDDEIVNIEVFNIKSNRITKGHRFLGKSISLDNANQYLEKLENEFVLADAKNRKEIILNQIYSLAKQNDWVVDIDQGLLEEVNNLVEYPTVFYGSFDKEYLKLPDVVLITSMKDNQRYFYARDKKGNLLPVFIAVRNGNKDYLENIILGNEKVLTARLEDAKFFFNEDQKQSIEDYVELLKKVMFHDKIGSIYQKMERVALISDFLAHKLNFGEKDLKNLAKASSIYKFDLVTGMVGEFSELQGIMGEIYAKLADKEEIAAAMREEYLPLTSEGKLPKTDIGAMLSIADKIDTIQAFFGTDMLPTGSNDPYALRRQAIGIVRILFDKKWNLSFNDLYEAILYAVNNRSDLFEKIDYKKNLADMREFIEDRVRQILSNQGFKIDILKAVTANPNNAIKEQAKAADVIMRHLKDDDAKEVIEALTRVIRLANKEDVKGSMIDVKLFENESESNLYKAYQNVLAQFSLVGLEDKYNLLKSLKDPIDNYYKETMIMVDNQSVKNNRLTQLKEIAKLTEPFGDLLKLNVK